MTTATELLKQIKDNDVKFVDLRFTDPKGKMQHVTMDVSCVDEDMFSDGVMFDGSSIAGWKAINESDMVLMPDTSTAHMDPFFAQSTMAVFCDVLDPITGEAYSRDPRTTAKKAEAYLQASGLGDTVYIGPEPEFFIFDDVKYKADPYNTGFKLDSTELPSNDDTDYETGNMGHRPRTKGGYFPLPPIDSCQDMRSEMLTVLAEMGLTVEKHHHEVASAQHELCMVFDTLTRMADKTQIYKYGVHQVAHAYGKTATFMPKPVFGRQRVGHCMLHQVDSGKGPAKPTFAATNYCGLLSVTCLLLHRRHLQARQGHSMPPNPSTTLQSSFVPGYEAPGSARLLGAQPLGLRAAIPFRLLAQVQRVEVGLSRIDRQPLPRLRAMLMAGIDGIKNNPSGHRAMDRPLRPAGKELKEDSRPSAGSLREALENLDRDRKFLTPAASSDDTRSMPSSS